ncbi:MAG TPA: thymidine phosphorylase [Candidatus Brocadiia bacterium]|nr:thymidine phosphorylase [Candidatus Brocadiales bacterium]
MSFVDIIRKKRNGKELTQEEISCLIQDYTNQKIPDYQMSAFLVAVYFQGMSANETVWLTEAIMCSGEVIDLSSIPGKKIDKHSTGGVGDKVSIVLAPLVASLGIKVPMIAGRGLGHTGGTIDKLESIPGFRTNLSTAEFKENVADIGVCIASQSEAITPAESRLYALRDVTGTVESIPLIVSSIMAKKLVAGIDGLVLDVKTGSGAFMKEYDKAHSLAKAMIEIGKGMGKPTIALITDMNQPLGKMVGNATEIAECIDTLKGKGPPDLIELTILLGAYMLILADIYSDLEAGKKALRKMLQNGKAYEKFKAIVSKQGGDTASLETFKETAISKKSCEVLCDTDGYVHSIDTFKIGIASNILGAGRKKLGDKIDYSVGIEVLAKIGAKVTKDQPLARLFYANETSCTQAKGLIKEAYKVSAQKASIPVLIQHVMK